jgi:outer membrane protein OmpA-like peptidoglycan-associated protein/tetratricopeptide (TPR) repeat protein
MIIINQSDYDSRVTESLRGKLSERVPPFFSIFEIVNHYFAMRQLALIFFCLILTTFRATPQDKKVFKQTFVDAEFAFMTEEYEEALHHYNELLKMDPENGNLHFLAGACYLSLYGEKQKAIPHLEIAIQGMTTGYREGSYKERNAPRESFFALARAYHINHEFDLAIDHYQKYRNIMFKKHFAEVEYVNKQIKSCELAMSMTKQPRDIQFLSLGDQVNQFACNYNPVVSMDDSTLVYMTDQPAKRTIMTTHRMKDGWSKPKSISMEIGSEGDCYPTCMSFDGKELFLVKRNYDEADIYVSYKKGAKWTSMVRLNKHINTDYFETHAFITNNGKALFFTSDRPGGQGAMDIWVSETTTQGDWGPPRNLGPKINSHYNEETPFLTEDSKKLYFSSQGHATMGGYDIFIAEKIPSLEFGQVGVLSEDILGEPFSDRWSFCRNAGYPISTADDDLFYVPRKNGRRGYYAIIIDSIRPERQIYTMMPVLDEEIQIAAIQQDVELSVELPAEELKRRIEETPGDTSMVVKDSSPETLDKPPPGETDPDIYFVLNSIMFEFDSFTLNEAAAKEADRISEAMESNPEIKLELTGHTDEIGADEYNLRLSERRAQSVADYLTSRGIGKERIRVRASGESEPIAINKYEDGTDSPEGRRLNRHVSLKFENLQDEKIKVDELFVPDHLRSKKDQSFSVLLINSDQMLDTIPDEVAGERTALIITDSAYLYTAGNYHKKTDALIYLNEVVDLGYPDAGMFEKRDLEQLIAKLSAEGIMVEASFTIQIMALKKPVRSSYFLPLKEVIKYTGRDGIHRYVYGEYDGIDQALDMLPTLKDKGYHDAFIMSVLRYRRLQE